jgi:hypothetical protein
MVQNVQQIIKQHPSTSIRRLRQQVKLCYGTYQKFFNKDINLFPFVLQEIKPTHYPKQIDSFIRVFEIMRGEFDSVWTTMENILSSFCENLFFDLGVI